MNDSSKLVLVKLVHTLIWVGFNVILGYLFYGVIVSRIDTWFWVGVAAILLECAVLVFNKWVCPLTHIARQYSSSQKDNFDIYLPNWLARHNIAIYSTLAVVLVIIAILKYVPSS